MPIPKTSLHKKKEIKNKAITIILFLAIFSFGIFALTQDTKAQIISQYQQAQQNYTIGINDFNVARSEYFRAREDYRMLKNVDNRIKVEQKSRIMIEKALLAMDLRLDVLRVKAESIRVIKEEKKKAIIDDINTRSNWLKSEQEKIKTIPVSQLVAEAKIIISYWKEIQIMIKISAAEIMIDRYDSIIAKMENFSNRLEQYIEKLKLNGKDISGVGARALELKKKIDLAKDKNEEARVKLQSYSGSSEKNSVLIETRQSIKDTDLYLREGYNLLAEIIKEEKKR